MVQWYTAPPINVAAASALAPATISAGALMTTAGQVPICVVAEAALFDEFGSGSGDDALTPSCTEPLAEEAMFQALPIGAPCPAASAGIAHGKLPVQAPLFALNVSPADAVALTVTSAASGPSFVTTML